MRNLRSLLLAAALCSIFAAPAARAGVILSELCDPQNNFQTDRFIEIYNSGPGTVDLTNWQVIAVANNVEVCTWTLSGSLPVGQARVCGHTTTVTGFTVNFQNSLWGTSAYFNWNGRAGDGARLKNGSGVLLDQVVATVSPTFENADYVRIPSVTDPTTTYNPAEWTSTAVTLATDATPGTHNGSLPPPAAPVVSNVVTLPLAPPANTPVHVQATVVDTSGPIASVTMTWGLTSGSLPNFIPLSLLSDSTYQTQSQIPGQGAGTTVYFRVFASGDNGVGQSGLMSYTIPGTSGAPTILAVGETSDSTLLVVFSEPVQEAGAEVPSNYSVGVLGAVNAVWDPAHTSQVSITVRDLTAGSQTLSVSGVQDLDGNATAGATKVFTYIDVSIPPGYYNGTAGLVGSALRVALHNIIKNHTVRSYDYVLTAFATTDMKPTGKIWDMYSDVPGGTPPYEYDYGQTGQGATEGLGYNREHSFPQSWFNSNSPMQSDLHQLFPTDAKVNGYRANYPYGEVGTATTTSLNGSKLGPSVTPGYSGTVFEPIDAFKGDLARGQFYMATRYFGQDGSWPGSASFDGANPVPWAATQYLQWHLADPPSWKDRLRNGAVYVHQSNRNPFVDHPEFLAAIWDSNGVTGVEPHFASSLRIGAIAPNPFSARASIALDLPRTDRVTLEVFDLAGRLVRSLANNELRAAGPQTFQWNGRNDSGTLVEAGLYFLRARSGGEVRTGRLVFAR